MGLLHKEKIICPKCGKPHTVKKSSSTTYNLDASRVRSIQKHMESYIICECGALCWNKACASQELLECYNTAQYQQILNDTSLPDAERKLLLLWCIDPANIPTWLAHYYYQKDNLVNRKKWLQIAIEQIISLEDNPSIRIDANQFPSLKAPRTYPFTEPWFYNPEFKLIDLYRQVGDFKKATQLITQYQANEVCSEIDNIFLQLELQLIRNQDMHVY